MKWTAWSRQSELELGKAGRHLWPPTPSCHNHAVANLGEPASPIQISKMVLHTVQSDPPDLIKSRTFTLRVR